MNGTSEVMCPFCQGVTTTADWSKRRTAPAPWAELEGDNIVLTMPSTFVRSIEHPEKLMALWQDIMVAIADLAAIPPKLVRKERIVTDVQISHGNCLLYYFNIPLHLICVYISTCVFGFNVKEYRQCCKLCFQDGCMPAIPSWDTMPQHWK